MCEFTRGHFYHHQNFSCGEQLGKGGQGQGGAAGPLLSTPFFAAHGNHNLVHMQSQLFISVGYSPL